MDTIQPGEAVKAIPAPDAITSSQAIHFPNGNTALAVTTTTATPAAAIISKLAIPRPEVLFLVIGGANNIDESVKDRLKVLCNLGIARQAAEAEAAIIDGGTQAGIMEIMGQAIANRGGHRILLGIAPSDVVTYPGDTPDSSSSERVPLDPNHSHFVLVQGDNWGDETGTMYALADELSKHIPVVTILVNGGEIAKKEVWYSIQRGWPLLIIKGSGRMADTIATLWKKKLGKQLSDTDFNNDPALAEIIEKGDIHLFPLDGTGERFAKLLKQLLYRSPVLTYAWELFALYDKNAATQRKYFERLQLGIVSSGVIVTAMVVLQVLLRSNKVLNSGTLPDQIVHGIIVLLPIIVSVLIAGVSRFAPGSKWILLRASAEAIKREIYFYRTQAGEYKKDSASSSHAQLSSSHQETNTSPREKFTERIADISRQLMLTELNSSALRPYTGPIPPKMYGAEELDDGYSKLTPDQYIAIRIGDQLSYFRGKTNTLTTEKTRYYWLIFIAGGVGTLLAALGAEPLVALTAALAAAFASYLEYRQTEYTLVKYNQALSNLDNTRNLWMGLSEEKREKSFNELVYTTEQILETENVGWVRQMHDALASLREKQTKETQKQNPPSNNRQHTHSGE